MRDLRGRFLLLLVALLIVLRLAAMAARQSYEAPGPLAVAADLVVPPASVAAVASLLARQNVIAHPLVFRAAAYLTRNEGPIEAGAFRFRAHASLAEVLAELRAWRARSVR